MRAVEGRRWRVVDVCDFRPRRALRRAGTAVTMASDQHHTSISSNMSHLASSKTDSGQSVCITACKCAGIH